MDRQTMSSSERENLLSATFPSVIKNREVSRDNIEPDMELCTTFNKLDKEDKLNNDMINVIMKQCLSNDQAIQNNLLTLINTLIKLNILPADYIDINIDEDTSNKESNKFSPYTEEEIGELFD